MAAIQLCLRRRDISISQYSGRHLKKKILGYSKTELNKKTVPSYKEKMNHAKHISSVTTWNWITLCCFITKRFSPWLLCGWWHVGRSPLQHTSTGCSDYYPHWPKQMEWTAESTPFCFYYSLFNSNLAPNSLFSVSLSKWLNQFTIDWFLLCCIQCRINCLPCFKRKSRKSM